MTPFTAATTKGTAAARLMLTMGTSVHTTLARVEANIFGRVGVSGALRYGFVVMGFP